MATAEIKIEGMSCPHCVMAVKKAVDALEGVSSSEVEVGKAKVEYDQSKVAEGDIEAAVVKAGYKVVK